MFCKRVIAPALGWPIFPLHESDVADIIDSELKDYRRKYPSSSRVVPQLTPIELEKYCAETLINSGWDARTTTRTGDQGVDIVATKKQRKVVLQCKIYKYPVGNKAVQECYSAKDFSRADSAVVVTNSKFIRSAKQLASSLGVVLMHYSELEHLDEKVIKKSARN